ncbi:MAG: glutamyl-tRNA reductase [Pedosphaera sp.]|nr:glutamyl-tRNA reductase [Pedosphaera sp.]
MPFIVVGTSHHTSPVEVRERFAFAESLVPSALARLRAEGRVDEAVILSTCNRVEIYASSRLTEAETIREIRRFLETDRQSVFSSPTESYSHGEPESLQHLFKVAAGLDSLVLGETEILGQIKKAYDIALQGGHTGKALNKAFQKAFSVAKQVRTETGIQRGSTSIGSVAVDLAEKLFAAVRDCQVMVIGAGDTSEKTARALQSRGARSLLVSNRSEDKAFALAAELGGRAIRFDDWEREFAGIDIVISSTSAPHYILDRPKLERMLQQRPPRPLLLIDLAVPRDIDPRVDQLGDVFLYDVDDLQTIADEHVRRRSQEFIRGEEIVRQRVREFLGSHGPIDWARGEVMPERWAPEGNR